MSFMPFAATGIITPIDPDFANVELLIHADGSDGSTAFVDSSANARSITVNGAAEMDTAQSVFGGSSLDVSGAGSIRLGSTADLSPGAGDFTIEFRFRTTSPGSSQNIWDPSGTGGFQVSMYSGDLNVSTRSVGTPISYTGGISADTWYAVAVTRSGSTLRLFLDGVLVATTTYTYSYATVGYDIGARNTSDYLRGHIDEFRFTKGVARYTTNYTIADKPFPDE